MGNPLALKVGWLVRGDGAADDDALLLVHTGVGEVH